MWITANIKWYINWNDRWVIYHEPPRWETIYTHEYWTIMHNAELWQIKISADTFDDIIIADKNLWATTVFNYWDTISAANLGNVYQWWNNHAFPYGASSPTVSTSQVDMSSYTTPSTYSSSTFINVSTSNTLWTSWSATQWINLRWNTTNTEAARKGPCAAWYHVPSLTEVNNLINAMKKIGLRTGNEFSEYLKMPIPGYYKYYNGIYVQYEADRWGYWTSTFNTSAELPQSYVLHIRTTNNTSTSYNIATGQLCPIRPFVNTTTA